MRVLLVGINPGMRSEAIGHHFAGYSNRFWKLLHESRLVPEPIGTEHDDRLPEWGFGITNLVAPGDARHRHAAAGGIRRRRAGAAAEGPPLEAGGRRLRRRDRLSSGVSEGASATPAGKSAPRQKDSRPLFCGPPARHFEGARVFVLPNPSGRNANFTYAQMLDAYRALAAYLSSTRARP